MDHGEPPGTLGIDDHFTTEARSEWTLERRENPKAVKRIISFPGQIIERINPFTRNVEDTCDAIVRDVRARGGLIVTISFRIDASRRENGIRCDTDFSITFEPNYRNESRVQELLLEIIIDDALEELANNYRGAYERIIDKAPPIEKSLPLLGHALESPHETPSRNSERGQNHRNFGGAGGFNA